MSLFVAIKKKLGRFQLDVNFETENGILALLGASGSGKSMTLKCIAGIETPDEGEIILDGRVLFDSKRKINLTPQKREVGYLFQNYALFPNMTARQNIEAAIKGTRDQKRRAADTKIEALYLHGLENKYPAQLSGGQQQRVALARILANEPKMIMLDEPLSALDSYLKWQLEMELTDTLAKFDGITLFVSHNRDEVYRLCDNVCVVSSGSSEPVITVPELFNDPRTLSSALLSGCKNYSGIKKTGEFEIEALDWGIRLKTEHPVKDEIKYIGVRAHYIEAEAGDDGNIIDCHIVRVIDDVFSTVVMLKPKTAKDDSDYAYIRIEMPKDRWKRPESGDDLRIHINPADILLLR